MTTPSEQQIREALPWGAWRNHVTGSYFRAVARAVHDGPRMNADTDRLGIADKVDRYLSPAQIKAKLDECPDCVDGTAPKGGDEGTTRYACPSCSQLRTFVQSKVRDAA